MRTPQSHTAVENPLSQHTLEVLRMPLQAKIAAAWTSFMFLYIYVDFFNLYKPGVVDGILNGLVWRFDVTPTLLTIMLASVAIPALMVMLSMTLPARVNRATNLVVASLYIPYSMFNAAGATWDWAYFYGLSIGLEVLLLAFILRSAWTWPRRTASPATLAASLDSEPLRTPQQA
jgi:ABC-type amino acid transport system permease subunit